MQQPKPHPQIQHQHQHQHQHQQLQQQHSSHSDPDGTHSAALRLSPPSESQGPGPPSILQVTCGGLLGTLLVNRCKVLVDVNTSQEREVTPTEFERLGGRAATKKWKQSIRVINSDGTPGRPVGEWLSAYGLDLRANSMAPLISGMRRLEDVEAAATHGAFPELTLEEAEARMSQHLRAFYVGLAGGDPTVGVLPRHIQYQQPAYRTHDLTRMTYEELLNLTQCSSADPMQALINPPPGIMAHREAYVTGHAPPRRPREVNHTADKSHGLAELADYLAGTRQEPPWQLLGVSRPPVVGDTEVNLRQLYQVVRTMGGYEEVCKSRAWTTVASTMGLPSDPIASLPLRTTFQRFLLRHERQEQALGKFSSTQTGPPNPEPLSTLRDTSQPLHSSQLPIGQRPLDLDQSLGQYPSQPGDTRVPLEPLYSGGPGSGSQGREMKEFCWTGEDTVGNGGAFHRDSTGSLDSQTQVRGGYDDLGNVVQAGVTAPLRSDGGVGAGGVSSPAHGGSLSSLASEGAPEKNSVFSSNTLSGRATPVLPSQASAIQPQVSRGDSHFASDDPLLSPSLDLLPRQSSGSLSTAVSGGSLNPADYPPPPPLPPQHSLANPTNIYPDVPLRQPAPRPMQRHPQTYSNQSYPPQAHTQSYHNYPPHQHQHQHPSFDPPSGYDLSAASTFPHPPPPHQHQQLPSSYQPDALLQQGYSHGALESSREYQYPGAREYQQAPGQDHFYQDGSGHVHRLSAGMGAGMRGSEDRNYDYPPPSKRLHM